MSDLDPIVLVAAAVGIVLLLIIVVMVSTRRRRAAALAPSRLGPAWQPPATADPDNEVTVDPPEVEPGRIRAVAERSGWDEAMVTTVLVAWHEYLGVVGLRRLPADYDYRVYDPYDPPVVQRAADRTPIADPERVARDVAARSNVPEPAAMEILSANGAFEPREDGASGHLGQESGFDPRD